MDSDVDVLVAGGGISGLAIAAVLVDAGLSVQIWEQNERAGGKIQSDADGGYVTDRAACMVLNFRPEVARFVSEFGLNAEKLPRPKFNNRYVVHEGRLAVVPMRLGKLLRSPLWSTRGKLRLALEPLLPKGGSEDETVAQFITRRLGSEIYEKAFDPYVAGPLASNPHRANARTVLPRLTELERRYGSLIVGMVAHRALHRSSASVTESFSFRGGMATLTNALADTVGHRLRTGCGVVGLEPHPAGWQIYGASSQGSQTLRARRIVLSVPAARAADLVSDIDAELAQLLRGVEYAPIVVVHTGFDSRSVPHPLDGNGFLVPQRENMSINGCLWTSSLFPARAPDGKVLLTSYLGGARRPAATDWGDTRCVTEVSSAIARLLGGCGDPEMVRIDRHDRGLPVYHGRYCGRLKAIELRLSEHPGLYLEANYRDGVSVRDRVARAYTIAERIRRQLRSERNETSTERMRVRPLYRLNAGARSTV